MDKRKPTERLANLARHGLRPRSPAAFGFAVLCVAVATGLRAIVDLFASSASIFSLYFPAILIATLIGGRAAGALAVALTVAVTWYLFVEPRYVWLSFYPPEVTSMVLFVLASAVVIWVAEGYRRVLRRLDEEEEYRRVVLDELGHRVKNKLATIHAVLRHELRGQQDIWQSVSGRLRALSAADDFLLRPDGRGIGLREILGRELEPYGENRVRLRGEPVWLHGRLSGALTLIVHELATNAAKYGALSREEGCVTVAWREEHGDIAIDWVETGGPPVTAPEKRGFGTNLIERSLDGLQGDVQIEFAARGVICRIRVPKTSRQAEGAAA